MAEECPHTDEYEPRRPELTVLYRVVQHHLGTWLVNARADERVVPGFVEDELRGFLECGILANGFLRIHCDACTLDRVVPFSCKGRGFCPSCGGRHMSDTAAHLVDRVLPRVPVRQWVLSLPFGLRYRLAYDRELTADVLRVFVRAVLASARRRSGPTSVGQATGHGGAVTFVQRFGGALNLNVHFHSVVLDGAYRVEADGTTLRFHLAPPPSHDDLQQVLDCIVRGIVRLLERRGLGDEPDRLTEDDPLLAQLLAAAVQSRTATGPRAGQRMMRFGDRVDLERGTAASDDPTPGLARRDGFSLHAGVAVPANDRQRLERLCRYTGRPPIASERLRELPDGRLLYELRHRWRDGTTHVAFEPLELIDRLAALVPPPRFHTVRYHGVLASRSRYRSAVVPASADPVEDASAEAEVADARSDQPNPASRRSRPSRYYSWSELMRRVFQVDVLRCPRCRSSPMRILAAIHPPTVTVAILQSLGLPARAPPIAPARSDSQPWDLGEPRLMWPRAG